jgi:hypothetical protein
MKYYDPKAREQDSNVKANLKQIWYEVDWILLAQCGPIAGSYLTYRILERVGNS